MNRLVDSQLLILSNLSKHEVEIRWKLMQAKDNIISTVVDHVRTLPTCTTVCGTHMYAVIRKKFKAKRFATEEQCFAMPLPHYIVCSKNPSSSQLLHHVYQ
jgi:hypothetical protein